MIRTLGVRFSIKAKGRSEPYDITINVTAHDAPRAIRKATRVAWNSTYGDGERKPQQITCVEAKLLAEAEA